MAEPGYRDPARDASSPPITGNTFSSSFPGPRVSFLPNEEQRHDAPGDFSSTTGERLDSLSMSPPATSRQALLENEPGHAQFATYPDEKDLHGFRGGDGSGDQGTDASTDPKWLPIPLRWWFWVPLVIFLVLGAIGLEIALHFSKVNQGWASSGDIGDAENALHYLYTLPPVMVAAILVAAWAWTDVEIKKMQPYVDLVHGDSPPHRSLLLDYTRHNNFFVWARAAANKHYLVVLSSLMALLALSFQPLAAALLAVRDVWLAKPDVNIFSHRTLGLNLDSQFNDLTSFLTASGYAGATVLYDLGDPPFIHQEYTVGIFDLPTSIVNNGSVVANTTATKSIPNCQPISVNMTPVATGWNNSMSFNNCDFSWSVDRNATTLFGTDTPTCNPPYEPQFSPVIFWFFTYETTPAQASATFCKPTLELWDVTATVDISTGNLTAVTELQRISYPSNSSPLAGNITGAPLNGNAYNGVQFNLTVGADEFVQRRLEALQLQLPAAMLQAGAQSPEGVLGSFQEDKFVNLATQVYTSYLALVASTTYFLPQTTPLVVAVKYFQQRVFLSDTAVHLLAAAMLLLAVFATIIQLFHRQDRRQLTLKHEPGTIASAVSIGAQTGMGELLAGRQRSEDIDLILRGKRFRIDPRTMKIIMEGEDGYDIAASPMQRRQSVFAALQSTKPLSRRFSGWQSGTSKSPGSPLRPQDA